MSNTNVPAVVTAIASGFIADHNFQKGRWRETTATPEGVQLHYHWTGQGRDALEVALATSTRKLSAVEARALWAGRYGRSAAPLLTIVLYAAAGEVRALLCGPSGDSPAVVELDANQAERLAEAALKESNRHQAAALIRTELEQAGEDLAGLNNKGLLATHELVSGVPARSDWQRATEAGKKLLRHRDHELIRALGYEVEAAGHHHILRSKGGNARAIAVFLEPTELPDAPSLRLDSNTPVSYALAQADRENLPWVISIKGSKIRLYSTTTSGAVGQRGRAETFIELNLNLLPDDQAGYLPLLLSSSALEKGGSFYEIQDASRTYATGLSERLRERVYGQAVPRLALSIAKEVGGTSEADLAQHYRTALTILFRLLFISYAEDSKLLPLGINGDYTDHSLKNTAVRISEGINAGRELGFDNPFTGASSEKPDEQQFNLWREAQDLFKAVDKGHTAWGVPAYNGGLFSPIKETNPVGHIIETLSLSNADFGPALTALTIDRTPDGTVGPIDFRSLSVREFGTIYEGLLESELSVAEQDLTLGKDATYLPAKDGDEVIVAMGEVYLHNKSGQRKASGAYFTKPFAVEHLLDKALAPTLREHLERVKGALDAGREADAADLLFDFRVADISMGSGHFLTAVVDRIEAQVSAFLAENPIPHVTQELDALRSTAEEALGDYASGIPIENASLLRRLIARRCVYGVDINPISVELARVSMWIHTFVPGLPLSFLNHNLVTGDSLTGIGTIEEAATVLEVHQGPDQALQSGLFNDPLREALAAANEPLNRMAKLVDATPKDIAAARAAQAEVLKAIEPVTAFFDTMVAVRLKERQTPIIASIDDLEKLVEDPARNVAEELNSLHFPIAFPEVFLRDRPGFDITIGNPPWEKMHVETHEFWARHFPGLRALPRDERDTAIQRLSEERLDLVGQLEREKLSAAATNSIHSNGPYPLGEGHKDLAQVFSWRFWHLVRQGGRLGIVAPRQAVLAAPGMSTWRRAILENGSFEDVALLTNRGEWVFDDVEVRYTIGLVTVHKGAASPHLVLHGPYNSLENYVRGMRVTPLALEAEEFASWGKDLVFPTIRSPGDLGILRSMLRHPKIGDNRPDWRFQPLQGDVNATAAKPLYQDAAEAASAVPVYSGSSFNLWNPETGDVYAWVDEAAIRDHLYERRFRQARTKASPYYGLPEAELNSTSTLYMYRTRIAFRDVARATDSRTVIAALIPSHRVLQHSAPFLVCLDGDASDEAYLLAFLSSRILDWLARLNVESHLTFGLFNALPVPAVPVDDPGRQRIIELAGRLAAADERYADWAAEVGVDYGTVPEAEAEDMKAELDACVARLYGLDEQQIRDLYATFHPTWDHEPWTEAVLEHYRKITWDPAEVPE